MSILKVERPFVSPDVLTAIQKLRKEGLEPTVEDICWLFSLTEKQFETTSLISIPVIIEKGYVDGSDIILPQITPGIRIWWDEVGRDMTLSIFKNNNDRIITSLAFCLASGLNDKLKTLTPTKFYNEVVTWSWAVKCSIEVLSIALLRALSEKESDSLECIEVKGYDPKALRETRFDVIVIISGLYGIDIQKLLWEYSEEQIQNMVENISSLNILKGNVMSGTIKNNAPDLKQLMIFRGAVQSIRDRLLKEASDLKEKESEQL